MNTIVEYVAKCIVETRLRYEILSFVQYKLHVSIYSWDIVVRLRQPESVHDKAGHCIYIYDI